jgi:hypothetical protein
MAGFLWVRSYHDGGDQWSRFLPSRQARYTLRSEEGRLSLFAPPVAIKGAHPRCSPRDYSRDRDVWRIPPPRPPLANQTLETLLDRVRNDDIEWACEYEQPGGEGLARPYAIDDLYVRDPSRLFCYRYVAIKQDNVVHGGFDPPLFTAAEMKAPLLAALERPDQFVAAHVILVNAIYDVKFLPNALGSIHRNPDGSIVQRFSNLPVFVPLPPSDFPTWARPTSSRNVVGWSNQPFQARFDESSYPAIRDLWHRRLDRQIFSARYSAIFASTGTFAAIGLAIMLRRALRAWYRRRHCLCVACGYDLRASPGRCPECGCQPSAEPASP